MKRILIPLVALVMLMGVRSFADTTSADTPHATMAGKQYTIEDRVKHLDEKLALSADQKTKVTEIFQNSKVQELSDKLTSGTLDKNGRHNVMNEMKTEMETVNKGIEAVLTDSQNETFKKMQAEDQKNMKQWKSGHQGHWQGKPSTN